MKGHQNKTSPCVTVIMPVYNTAPYLALAIESILNQTFSDFEFLIFDDSSTDNSLEIIKKYALIDDRIVYFHNDKNQGLVECLNQGIKISRGDYIARMDSDDISELYRLENQIAFLQENKEIGIVGGWIEIFPNFKKQPNGHFFWPKHHDEILAEIFFGSPFNHPTVTFRRSLVTEGEYYYKKEDYPAEDYHLWARLVFKTRTANIGKVLLKYRQHQNQISSQKNPLQATAANLVRVNYLNQYIPLSSLQKKLITLFWSDYKKLSSEEIIEVLEIYENVTKNHSSELFKKHFSVKMKSLIYYYGAAQTEALTWYKKSIFNGYEHFSRIESLLLSLRQLKWKILTRINP